MTIAARSGTADTESIGLVLIHSKSYLLPFGTNKSEIEGLPAVHPCVTRDTPTSPSRFHRIEESVTSWAHRSLGLGVALLPVESAAHPSDDHRAPAH